LLYSGRYFRLLALILSAALLPSVAYSAPATPNLRQLPADRLAIGRAAADSVVVKFGMKTYTVGQIRAGRRARLALVLQSVRASYKPHPRFAQAMLLLHKPIDLRTQGLTFTDPSMRKDPKLQRFLVAAAPTPTRSPIHLVVPSGGGTVMKLNPPKASPSPAPPPATLYLAPAINASVQSVCGKNNTFCGVYWSTAYANGYQEQKCEDAYNGNKDYGIAMCTQLWGGDCIETDATTQMLCSLLLPHTAYGGWQQFGWTSDYTFAGVMLGGNACDKFTWWQGVDGNMAGFASKGSGPTVPAGTPGVPQNVQVCGGSLLLWGPPGLDDPPVNQFGLHP